jgi:hypothetical protein
MWRGGKDYTPGVGRQRGAMMSIQGPTDVEITDHH